MLLALQAVLRDAVGIAGKESIVILPADSQLNFDYIERKRQKRKEICGCGKLVRQVLRDDPASRNSDKLLVLRVWQKQLDCEGTDRVVLTEANIGHIASAETLIRARARIQNDEGAYPPTDPKIRRLRGIKEEAFREWAQTNF